jgi:hypothetical protein
MMQIKERDKNTLIVIDGRFLTKIKRYKRGEKYVLICSCRVFQMTHECRHCAAVRERFPNKYARNMLNNIRMDEWFGNVQRNILNFLKSLSY